MSKKRIYYLTFAQIFSMLIIVLGHSLPKGNDVPLWISEQVKYLPTAGLTVFMWVSGFLTIATNQLEKYGYTEFVKRRAVRLLLPYFAISLLFLLPKFLLSQYTTNGVSLNPMVVLEQLLTPRDGVMPHLWFLPTLFLLSVMLPMWKWLSRNGWLAVGTMALLAAMIWLGGAPRMFSLCDVQSYALWFFLGICYATYQQEVEQWNERTKSVVPALVVIGGGISVCVSSINAYLPNLIYRLACLLVIMYVAKKVEEKSARLCDMVGKYSFAIYIVSLPIQNVVDVLSRKVGVPVEGVWVLRFVAGLVLSYMVAKMVERIEQNRKTKILSKIVGL